MKTYKGLMSEGSKEEYKKFFDGKLAKWKIKSPAELSDEDKKKFFDEIDKEWKGDNEKAEGLVKEFIKKDGARRRCAGGDGRKSKKVNTEEEDCDDDEDLDEAVDNDKVIFLKLFVKDVFKNKMIEFESISNRGGGEVLLDIRRRQTINTVDPVGMKF